MSTRTGSTQGQTLIEKILGRHSDQPARPGTIIDVAIDVRAARDFGGASVVRNLERSGLVPADPSRTVFTFDCNPGGSDQGYAANQQTCRVYARRHGVRLRDIDRGIGTHLAIDEGLVGPGGTFVSTDSHANILGAVGAFGQGMGDQDIAAAWAHGKVWFKVPETVKVVLRGRPSPAATAKDLVLAMARSLGANGLLGYAAEVTGDVVDELDVAARVTIASMATEMGGIIALFAPNQAVIEHCSRAAGRSFAPLAPDPDAAYAHTVEIDVGGLEPLVARPGHPDDAVPVDEVAARPIDSVFIGSCTNGRLEDLRAAAAVLRGRRVSPGVVLKIVPATRTIWEQALAEGLIAEFMAAGALVGNAGCGGCAAGQIGQNGPGEVTISSGNRNFPGKQGKGEVYLASPATCAASAVAGVIARADRLPAADAPVLIVTREDATKRASATTGGAAPAGAPVAGASAASASAADAGAARSAGARELKPTVLRGRVWLVDRDDVDTDMIYHNAHLAVTDPAQMGRHAFGNLPGWEDFPQVVRPGDVVMVGRNFGCGSSRQHAVDCFLSLGVAALVAESLGAIYERNAINAGLPLVVAPWREAVAAGVLAAGREVTLNLETGLLAWDGGELQGEPFSRVQMEIYQRGGLLAKA
ncbi:MAG: aconitase/3-isopropylmalate dehydratase large subunit family protein [Candidatus Krumholzibacteriia bacterium]